jgi:CRP/FNR family cyclic AMP-dependent transcriptional regulator
MLSAMDKTTQGLRDLAFFSKLSDDTLAKLAYAAHRLSFTPNQVIALEGEPCQALYVVDRGLVRTRRMSLEGREQVLAYYGPGQALDLVPAIDGGLTHATIDAASDVVLYAIPCGRFREMLRTHPDLGAAALGQLAPDMRRLTDLAENLALHTVRTRLARFLLSQAEDAPLRRQWTQEDIAAHIGTVREMVGRTLRSFIAAGIIRRERGRIVILDSNALSREASGG